MVGCQCPIGRLFLFYIIHLIRDIGIFESVNALSGGCSFSTDFQRTFIGGGEYVSMPYRAAVPFLPTKTKLPREEPARVNALSGGCSFSTFWYSFFMTIPWMCQCPIGRLFLFYSKFLLTSAKSVEVSMPYRAAVPFLRGSLSSTNISPQCVNALSGGCSFSTNN